ncbi:MAG: hypothetical protein MI741_03340 [Rhodospirillales bacterium]|nr:hypothetical protein [Rhodospirillales bacterium]
MLEDTSIGEHLTFNNRRELEGHFRRVCHMGANVIVGWRSPPRKIQIFHVPSLSLPLLARSRRDLLQLDRYVDSQKAAQALLDSGCSETTLSLNFSVGKNPAHIEEVNDILHYYSVTEVESRAVALFDMVSFSMHSPHEQITHVSVLSYYIKLAASRCLALDMPVEVCLTTTGDGFYVWNRRRGLDADIALFSTVVLALAYMYAARKLTDTSVASIPRLRCAVDFGSHYEYYQAGMDGAEAGGYIVGDVTISLARLVSKAVSGQLLVGSTFIKLGENDQKWRKVVGSDEIDSLAFLAIAQKILAGFNGVPIPSGRIASASVNFTGPRLSEDTFCIRKYYVTDKHGIDHPCFNAKLEVKPARGETISFGLVDEDLGRFDAKTYEEEDILIKIG